MLILDTSHAKLLPRKRLISCGCVLPLDIHAMVLVTSKPIGKASAASLATLHISWEGLPTAHSQIKCFRLHIFKEPSNSKLKKISMNGL